MDWLKDIRDYISSLREKGRRIKKDVYAGCYTIFGVY